MDQDGSRPSNSVPVVAVGEDEDRLRARRYDVEVSLSILDHSSSQSDAGETSLEVSATELPSVDPISAHDRPGPPNHCSRTLPPGLSPRGLRGLRTARAVDTSAPTQIST